jgi:hypothetical protein
MRPEEFRALRSLRYELLERPFSQDVRHDVALGPGLQNSPHRTIVLWNESDVQR